MKTSDKDTPFDIAAKARSTFAQLAEIDAAEAKAFREKQELERTRERHRQSGRYDDKKVRAELREVSESLEMIPFFLKNLDEMRGPIHEERALTTRQLIYFLDPIFDAIAIALRKTLRAQLKDWFSDRDVATRCVDDFILGTDCGETLTNLRKSYQSHSHSSEPTVHDSQTMLDVVDGLKRFLVKYAAKLPDGFNPFPVSAEAFEAALPDHVKSRLADVSKPKERLQYSRGQGVEILTPEEVEAFEKTKLIDETSWHRA